MRQIDLGAFGVSYRYIEGTLVDFSRLFPLHRPYTPFLTYPLLAVHYLHILIAVDVLLDILLTASCVQQPPSCIILPIWVFHCGFLACEAKHSSSSSRTSNHCSQFVFNGSKMLARRRAQVSDRLTAASHL